MPKLSYGPAAKARTQQLLRALLDYGNDELWAAEDATLAEQEQFERALDGLRPHLSTHWQSDRTLIIRTKIRHLAQLSQLATPDQPLTTNQIKEALSHLNKFLGILEDNRTSRRGSDTWHFTLHLGTDRRDDKAFDRWFSQTWEQNHPKSKSAPASPHRLTHDDRAIASSAGVSTTEPSDRPQNANPQTVWQALCRQDLSRRRHQELTTNPLTAQAGLSFSTDELYVPVMLVKRSPVNTQSTSNEPASRDSPVEDSEESDSIELVKLLQHLNDKSQSRISIIGEPGAGKTTLLQQTAAWILDQTNDIPLWISLADLTSPNELESHIFETWLKTALRQRTVPTEQQAELEKQFAQGTVWLLLDAVDEMALPASQALSQLAKQLDGYLGDVRVLLTSRLNVWHSSNNALVDFETYQLVGYARQQQAQRDQAPQSLASATSNGQGQISTFIQRWFQDCPEAADQLLEELFRPDRQRIRDAMRNPLRLALLCRCWSLGQGKLPETKALLYGQFVEAIYDWKQDCFPTAIAQRRQLDRVLGQIALTAMRQPRPRFRLPESLLFQALEAAGVTDFSWIDLALQLGWLTRSLGDREPTYRFYHATFQEYFAAQQIEDWQDFVAVGSVEPSGAVSDVEGGIATQAPASPAVIPIFSTAWREVILLWLGRPEIAQAEKAALMSYLMTFEDDCGGFYAAQAYLLAGLGLAEFSEFEQRDAIADQLLQWRFNRYGQTPKALVQETQRVLPQSDQATVIAAFERLLQDPKLYPFKRWMMAYSLGKSYDPGNELAIATLTELLRQADDWPVMDQIELAKHLGVIAPGNRAAITALETLLTTSHTDSSAGKTNPQLLRKAALRLGLIDPENGQAIAQLLQLLDNHPQPFFKQQLLEDLSKIAPHHPRLAGLAVATAAATKQSQMAAAKRRKAQRGDRQRAIAAILTRLEMATELEMKLRLAYRLGCYAPGHPVAGQQLLRGLREANQKSQIRRIVTMLLDVVSEEQLPDIVKTVRELYQHLLDDLETAQSPAPVEWERTQACYSILWHCVQMLSYGTFRDAWQGGQV